MFIAHVRTFFIFFCQNMLKPGWVPGKKWALYIQNLCTTVSTYTYCIVLRKSPLFNDAWINHLYPIKDFGLETHITPDHKCDFVQNCNEYEE